MILEQGLHRAARLWPDKIAVIDGDRRITYAGFAERVNRLANALRDRGLRPGDRVAMLTLNSFRAIELFYAVNVAGGAVVPLNVRLTVPELQFMLDDSASRFLFVGREFVEPARRLRDRCPALGALVLADDVEAVGDGLAPDGFLAYEALLAAAGPGRPPGEIAETDLAGIFYTGGTTGLPKGVMLSQRNLVDNTYRGIMHLGVGGDDVYLHAAPLFHIAGAAPIFFITHTGGTHVVLRAFDPGAVLDLIAREQVTSTLLVPTMITMTINHPAVRERDLTSLRWLVYGASPIAADTLRAAMAALPCDFVQAYGMTEAAPCLSFLSAADHRAGAGGHEPLARRLRSAGQPAIGIDLRVVDDEDRDVAPGAVGEIVARGDNIMLGYWGRPEVTAEAIRSGWYHTGDLATTDGDGYIYIVDRKKDMIITGGENVYSVEVENALYSHPAVLECAVIGVPDEQWGEAVKAIVVRRPGHDATVEGLIAHCQGRIAGYKAPKSVDFADALPKSAAGKILKREMRERYWSGRETRVQ